MKFKLSHFKFDLPQKLIPQSPNEQRDESKLMVLHKSTGEIEHKKFKDLIDYFDEEDVIVFNNTKVFPARMYGNKEKTGARIEVFLLRELNRDNRLWDVLVDPARKIRIGNKLYFGENDEYQPSKEWMKNMQLEFKILPKKSHQLYKEIGFAKNLSTKILKTTPQQG